MAVHLQVGREQRVAVVFSCPGRHEEEAGHPAARHTGKNLETLLSLLAKALRRDDLGRENITITNAWPRVEYRKKTGRSEATVKEVTSPDNLARLQDELDEITDFVIFCGKKATAAAGHLRLRHNPSFVHIRHLGLRGLSLIATDVRGKPIAASRKSRGTGKKRGGAKVAKNTEKRLAVLAHSISSQLQREEAERVR